MDNSPVFTPQRGFGFQKFIPGLTTSLVTAILEVPVDISFAALIFTGVLSPYLSSGIGVLLAGAAILSLVSTIFNSYPGSIALPQDTSAVIVAAMAGSIAALLADSPPDLIFLTVLAAITCSSVITGIIFIVLGSFRLGRLIRYIPYPVVGGFLAGSGLLLFIGGIGISANLSVNTASIGEVFQASSLVLWLPALLFAILLYFGVKHFSNPLALPCMLLAVIILFFGYLLVKGTSIEEAMQAGLLLGPFPEGNLWKLPPFEMLFEVDWSVILLQAGQITSLVVISTISLLLNASGVELIVRQDIDLNRELKSAGFANVASGFVSSIPGYLALTHTALSMRMSAKSRWMGVMISLFIVLALLFGAPLIELFPRLAAGGLLCFLGLTLLMEWVVQTWTRLSHWDYVVVIIIMATMGIFSPLAGVGIGLLLAAILFIFQYSRVNIIRHILDGNSYYSVVERSPLEKSALRQSSDWIYILELQGFIFFGSTQNLLDFVNQRLHDPSHTPPRFLLLDFRQVTGMDGSAIMSFVKLQTLTQDQPITILFANLPSTYHKQLEEALHTYSREISWKFFKNLDYAVEWCENQMVEELLLAQSGDSSHQLDIQSGLGYFFQTQTNQSLLMQQLMTYLERRELPAGSVLIRHGDPPIGLYIIESGQVSAHLTPRDQPPLRLRVMGPGVVVGELSLYLNIPATASVIATQSTVAHFMSLEKMRLMELENPLLANEFHKVILRLLGDRLRSRDQTIQALGS